MKFPTALLVAGALTAVPSVAGASTHKTTTTIKHTTHKSKIVKTKAQPWIGSKLTVLNENKQYLDVQLQAVQDPAPPAQYVTPTSGTRFVGVTVQITAHKGNSGTSTDDANSGMTIIGSNKQVYQFSPYGLANCTDFNYGTYTLPAGASEVGCVNFDIPNGVSVAKVAFNPNDGFSTNNAYWTAP